MYENKISARQLRRMIFIETFGAGALSIPAFACYKEQNGFWSLIFYGVFLAGTIAFFSIIFSGKISEENFENRKIGKTGLARNVNINVSKMQTRLKSINFPEVLQPIKFVYMIRFFINAVALFISLVRQFRLFIPRKQLFIYYFSCCDFALLQLVYNITKKSQIFRNHFSVDYHDVFYCCDFIIYRN